MDANGVGVAVGLVSEVDLIQGECSEAGCVVDLQNTLLEWQLSDDEFAGDHRQGIEHLGSWIAQDWAEPLRSPDLEKFVTLSGCRREKEQLVHRAFNSVGLDFQIDVPITSIMAPLVDVI